MAFLAAHRLVHAGQRKSIFLVQCGDVIDQPVGAAVATGAVRPHRLLVHIGVAGNTIRTGLRKDQAGVAGAAIHYGMLPG